MKVVILMPKTSKKIIKICPVCNVEFFSKRENAIYCSKKCSGFSRRKRVTKTCLYCGKIFEVTISSEKNGEGKHCSIYCKNENNKKTIMKTCLYCEKDFRIFPSKEKAGYGKHCSLKCRIKDYRTRVTKNCLTCGKIFDAFARDIKKGGGKYCSHFCYSEKNKGEKNGNWKGGISTLRSLESTKRKWKEVRKQVHKRDNYTCQLCGITTVQARNNGEKMHHCHHIIPFANEASGFDLNNLVLLCKKCHNGFIHSNDNTQMLYLASAIPREEKEERKEKE